MSFDTDPGEQARISACDLEQMCNEMRRLQHRNAQLEAKAAAAADMLEIVARCEMWLSTVPEGRAMQLACQAAIAKATGREIA
jgi:hypothetical protein